MLNTAILIMNAVLTLVSAGLAVKCFSDKDKKFGWFFVAASLLNAYVFCLNTTIK